MGNPNQLLRGRAPFILTKLSYFMVGVNGQPPVVPYHEEFCYDDLGDQSIGMVKYDNPDDPNNKTWKYESLAKDLNTFINDMKYGGVFDNALAGSFSRELTYFTFDSVKTTIILNQNLVYPHSYKYYAIRSGSEYITGKMKTDGSGVLTNLCGMQTGYMLSDGTVVPEKPVGANTTTYDLISKPMVGAILPTKEFVDSEPYVIEFFDETKRMIQRDVYFAESVQVLTGDNVVIGNLTISRIEVTSSRVYNGDPTSFFLYRQERPEQLANSFMVRLIYSDGTSVDVTHEFSTIGNGKGRILGLDTINTSVITQTNPSTITFEYTPLIGGGTVSSTKKVYIIEDNLAAVVRVIPTYTVKQINSQDTLIPRYFALMADNSIIEVTGNIATTGTDTLGNPLAPSYGGSTTYPLGSTSPVNVKVNVKTGYSNQQIVPVNFVSGVFTHPTKLAKIFSIKDLTTSPDRNYSFKVLPGNIGSIESRSTTNTAADVTNENKFVYDSTTIVPTHFRIRNMNGTWYYTNSIAMASFASFTFTQGNTSDSGVSENEPLIIEFFKVGVDAGGNSVHEITSIRCAYFKPVS